MNNEICEEKYNLDYKAPRKTIKKAKVIEQDEDSEFDTLPFYSNENEISTKYAIFEYFQNKFKNNFLFGEEGLIARFLKIFNSQNNLLNTGLFGRKTDFYLKKRLKLFYIYLFPYIYIFYRIFFLKIMVRVIMLIRILKFFFKI